MAENIVYFSGCAANFTDPDIGRAVIHVLERHDLVVDYPLQRCCGMPQFGQGKLEAAIDRAHFNVRSLSRTSGDVVTACTTCALMIKHYYPQLLNTDEAAAISRRTYDIVEYLVLLKEKGYLDTSFGHASGVFLYHAPCHLKSLGERLVERRIQLLGQIPGLSITQVDRGCCGLAGVFGATRRNRALSLQIGNGLFQAFHQMPDCQAATECPGCKLQIGRGTGVPVIHPIQLFQQAYGL